MDRLFVRACAFITVSLIVGFALIFAVVGPLMANRVGRNIGSVLRGDLLLLSELMKTPEGRARAPERMAELSAATKVPFVLVPEAETPLTPEELDIVRAGGLVSTKGSPFGAQHFSTIPGETRILRMGPLMAVPPWGEGRGVVVLVVILLSLFAGLYLLMTPIRRRLKRLSVAAANFGTGNLDSRVREGGEDAIGELCVTFDKMAAEIQQLVAARHELLHMVSHELRTPMQRMHFALEAAGSGVDGQPAAGHARVEQELDELDELITELLTYSRIERAGPTLRPSDLHAILGAVVQESRIQPPAPSLALHVPSSEDALMAEVDPRLIKRALTNLLSNAYRHAQKEITVTAHATPTRIVIDVEDDGCGIPAADLERVFVPFHRLDDDVTRQSKGFGLGLAIVRRIADAHAGTVHADTSPLGGARLRLSLPRLGSPPTTVV